MAKDNCLDCLTPAIVVSMEDRTLDRTFHSSNDLVFAVTETDERTESRDSVENRHAAIGALSQSPIRSSASPQERPPRKTRLKKNSAIH